MLPALGGCRLPPSTSSHASAAVTAHRVEVLGTLRAFAAHLLLDLQLWLRLVDGLPAVATVARPTTVIPVVAVHGAVFACIDVVHPSSDTCVCVGVVNKYEGAILILKIANEVMNIENMLEEFILVGVPLKSEDK